MESIRPARKVSRVHPTTRRPAAITAIEILGYVGVLFWLSTIVGSFTSGADNAGQVLIVGLILGGAHIVIALGARRRSRLALYAMAVVLISDSLLTIFVDVRAILLVLFTVVLIALAWTQRTWWSTATER